jgi:voltage-gated potassium channel
VALSGYVLLALLVERMFTITPQTLEILNLIDTAVCAVFIADFFVQLGTARSKLHYLRWGWIDLISSIPMLPALRWGRMVRIVRVIRVLRGFRAAKILTSIIFAHRAKGALATALFVCLVLVPFGSVTILHVETDTDSNIRTPGDALWWSLATLATVDMAISILSLPKGVRWL